MKGKTFIETQIVKILRELDSGPQATDVARENGISKAMLYNWRKKYSDTGDSNSPNWRLLKKKTVV
ncbi:transposase [Dyadobacter sp. BHUBP1]|uniref:transposase n=1 Tax=Dyadobacter sp. BHUBP1 TaxID=3424178 RepID=UPI003D330D26